MDEMKLIKKLELLKEVKPNTEWVAFSKREIVSQYFEKEETVSILTTFVSTVAKAFETPKVFAPVLSAMIVAVFGFALVSSQSTMPGDNLYSLKKAYDGVVMSFLSSEDAAVAKVKYADAVLAQLDKITKEGENSVRNIEASVEEAKKAIVVASREISKVPDSQKAELAGQLVSRLSEVEESTNASIMDNGSENIYSIFIESEIDRLETNQINLTSEQLDLLNQAKESFAISDYISAMDYIYQIQPKE
jgi:hypothetical protein